LEGRDHYFHQALNFSDTKFAHQVTWPQIKVLKTLYRNQFPGELKWQQHEGCSGFQVSSAACEFRVAEMKLVSYTPNVCVNKTRELCDTLVAYARINVKGFSV
jgi:hypothetical protein